MNPNYLTERLDLNIQSPLPYLLNSLSLDLKINLYLKQEDFASNLGINNKLRKLEYQLFSEKIFNSSVLISVGSLPSSQNVAVAYAANVLGIRSHIIYGGDNTFKPNLKSGNYYLASKFNPTITWFENGSWSEHEKWINIVKDREIVLGNNPIIFESGLSSWPGLLGYTKLGLELNEYFKSINKTLDYIVCPFGSGGIFSGLVLSNLFTEKPPFIVGMTFAQEISTARDIFTKLAVQIKSYLNYDIELLENKSIIDGTLNTRYAELNEEMILTSDELVLKAGLLLDNVYNLKTYITLKKNIQDGIIPVNSNVLLLLTGTCYNEISSLIR